MYLYYIIYRIARFKSSLVIHTLMKQSNKTTGYFLIALGVLQFAFYLVSKGMEGSITFKGLILPIIAAGAFVTLGIMLVTKKAKK